MSLERLATPCLVLDRAVVSRNCRAMAERMGAQGVRLRPHLKTAKSAQVAALATAGQFGGITVSTLAEARYFADQGITDMTYAVGLVPDKLDQVAALIARGLRLTLLSDCPAMVAPLAEGARARDITLPLLIEIDCGGRRGGVGPDSDALLALGRAIHETPGLALEGVLTHAGQSYGCASTAEIAQVAETERAAVTGAAERLRGAGLPCPVVSAGSTPTAVFARSLEGITEMRPGVYVFFDLDQEGLGVCRRDDIALTVLASVIGHNRRARRILIDAGALALSKDLSAKPFFAKVGYGLISSPGHDGLYVAEVHQEHGLIAAAAGEPPYDALPVGSRLRILPNHACITAAAHSNYQVIEDGELVDQWQRCGGW